MQNLISITDLSKAEILSILAQAQEFKREPPGPLLQGQVLASCFFEPSTRTRLSFESAMLKLGGSVIGFSESSMLSTKKGETLCDTMKIIGDLADVIVLRHPKEGAARVAADCTLTPLINAGDGANQHPTQTLVDLFTMKECLGNLEGCKIAFVGDLKGARTIHSLVEACALFDMRLYFVCPKELSLPDKILTNLRKKGIIYSFHQTIEEVVGKVDILYMTRLQKERMSVSLNYPSLTLACLEKAQEHLKILHPLPRVDEIDREVDATSHAYYFQQAKNGIYVRGSLLTQLLKNEKNTLSLCH